MIEPPRLDPRANDRVGRSIRRQWAQVRQAAREVRSVRVGTAPCLYPQCDRPAAVTFRLPRADGSLYPPIYTACGGHAPPGGG